jgi:hypothetical protein
MRPCVRAGVSCVATISIAVAAVNFLLFLGVLFLKTKNDPSKCFPMRTGARV